MDELKPFLGFLLMISIPALIYFFWDYIERIFWIKGFDKNDKF